jgi:hypothetical protein
MRGFQTGGEGVGRACEGCRRPGFFSLFTRPEDPSGRTVKTPTVARAIVLSSVALLPLVGLGIATADSSLGALERTVIANPEDLRASAEYRQQAIALGEYDRSISFFKSLTAKSGSGPNVFISLALAYVDKVPVASPFRRIFLGRDAMLAASQAIAREPSLLAFFIRGLAALYYPEAVFHRARGGIADLEYVRQRLKAIPAEPYHVRVFVSLGDGYWRVHELPHAVSIWTEGLGRFPDNGALRERVSLGGADLDQVVGRSLDPAIRVDTSLSELFAGKLNP